MLHKFPEKFISGGLIIEMICIHHHSLFAESKIENLTMQKFHHELKFTDCCFLNSIQTSCVLYSVHGTYSLQSIGTSNIQTDYPFNNFPSFAKWEWHPKKTNRWFLLDMYNFAYTSSLSRDSMHLNAVIQCYVLVQRTIAQWMQSLVPFPFLSLYLLLHFAFVFVFYQRICNLKSQLLRMTTCIMWSFRVIVMVGLHTKHI